MRLAIAASSPSIRSSRSTCVSLTDPLTTLAAIRILRTSLGAYARAHLLPLVASLIAVGAMLALGIVFAGAAGGLRLGVPIVGGAAAYLLAALALDRPLDGGVRDLLGTIRSAFGRPEAVRGENED